MLKRRLALYALFVVIFSGCANYELQYANDNWNDKEIIAGKRTLEKRFYLIGDAGGAKQGKSTDALIALKKVLDTTDTQNAYTVFLGDNVYDKGLPDEAALERADREHKIDAQLDAVQDFKGDVFFIPGNHDWYDSGLKGVKRQQKYIEEKLGDSKVFQPKNGCPIEKINVTDNIVMLLIDTQWYLANWDEHPTINDNCDIKTREAFFLELSGELKKNNEKTILIAMHHPMFTNGIHGGKFAIKKHLFPSKKKLPLPVLASLVTQLRGQGGVSKQDRSNKKYSQLMDRMATLVQGTNKTILMSGHEHSLQYIENDGIKQIISGAGAKNSGASLGGDGLFAYGGQGFAVLDVFNDGSSTVRYFSAPNGEPQLVFNKEIHPASEAYDTSALSNSFKTTQRATVYDKDATDKKKRFTRFWGNHYRKVYGTDIEVPLVTLDTLMGGLTIERLGGGNQTRSLRLVSPSGRNFAMRAVKKSAVQFLQAAVFTEDFVQEKFRETLTEDIIQDFYTASHPFASLAVVDLSDAVGVYHTNPQLVWMPKHPALGKYNATHGDQLYMIEERPDDGFTDVVSFGKPDRIQSTADMLDHLKKDQEYTVDQDAYVRARLFDMLLGDWDRHQDQWRWARFDTDKGKMYRPIPRDRDQVFSNYDGRFLDVVKAFIPATRKFQEYDGELKNIKWINIAGSKLDQVVLPNTTKDTWLAQSKIIQDNLTDQVIDRAFAKFPKEVQSSQLEEIKMLLKQRRANMRSIASRYYDHLSKLVIFKGTDKDDHFEITREANGTRVQISRIKDGEIKNPFVDRLLSPKETREIWIYGLDDDDTFRVSGKGKKPILTRIVGGQNNDTYTIEDGRRVKIYDHKTKPNTIKEKGGATITRSNIYAQNTYDFNKTISKVNSILPAIFFNPDNGLVIGIQDTYVVKGFKNDPFYRKHIFRAGYYSATGGFEGSYRGEFANAIGNWNLTVGGNITTEAFAFNFFGRGNETENNDAIEPLGLDFNRIRAGQYDAHLGIVKDNSYGSRLSLVANFQSVAIEETLSRFISRDFETNDSDFFERKNFVGIEGAYSFHSTNNDVNPNTGMLFDLALGSKVNLEDTNRIFGYIKPSLTFYNALTRNKKWVLKTQAQGQFNIGDDFEFYQGATLGATNGLRGFRNERFTGESALAGSADLRYSFNQVKTGFLPIQLGLFGGGDIGRVWLDGEESDLWHTSIGGGFWINAVDIISGQFGLFHSTEGLRFSFGLGVNF